jgi:6-pyruvoyltetrahydropterin/6-carboxytetrahydropterin synthase
LNCVTITRVFSFEAAHALKDYNGPCKNIHGHSYKLWVTVSGIVDAGTGMIMDFNDLKKIVNETIISKFDHALILYRKDKMLKSQPVVKAENLLILPFNPTSENLIIYFSELIKKALPEHTRLYGLKLYETDSSFTEWFSVDYKTLQDFNNQKAS